MHCTQCGNSILPDTRFCPNCGAPVTPPAATHTASYSTSYTARPTLLRPRRGRMLGGVCAAFARTYGWSVILIRILLVALVPLHLGLGFIAYIVAWILIPEEPYVLNPTPPRAP